MLKRFYGLLLKLPTSGRYVLAVALIVMLTVVPVYSVVATTGGGTFNLLMRQDPLNEAPQVTRNNGLTVDEGASAVIGIEQLNITDRDNSPAQLTYTLIELPVNGELSLDRFTQQDINDGLVTYAHNDTETTTDRFTFRVEDGSGGRVIGEFLITVAIVDDPPTLVTNEVLSVVENGAVALSSVELSATDGDTPIEQITYRVTSPPGGGSLSVDTFTQLDLDTGLVVYTHDGTDEPEDSFDFIINEQVEGTVTVTVELTNDVPVVTTNSGVTLDEAATAVISNDQLLAFDPDTDPEEVEFTVTVPPSRGTLSLTTFTQADIEAGLLTYTHNGSETSSDQFEFVVTDNVPVELAEGEAAPPFVGGIVSIVINPVPDPPTVLTNTGITLDEGAAVVISNATLASGVPDNPTAPVAYTITQPPEHGTLSLEQFTQADVDNGLLTYSHDGSQTTEDSFTFTVSDERAVTVEDSLSIIINPINDPATLDANTGLSVTEGASAPITSDRLLSSDIDNSPDQLVYTVVTPPTSGSLSLNSFTQADIDNGLVTYSHNGDETTSDSFEFVLDDGSGFPVTSSFLITVELVDDLPAIVSGEALNINEGDSAIITGAALAVVDPDSDVSQLVFTVTEPPESGTLSLDEFRQADIDSGLLVYTHDGSQSESDRFVFTISDGEMDVLDGTFTIAITPINDPASLDVNTGLALLEGETQPITSDSLLSSDIDNAPNQLTYTVTIPPVNGELSLGSTFTQADIDNGLLTYTHNGSETTSDSFEFLLEDGSDQPITAIFAVTVELTNDAPSLVPNTGLTLDEGGQIVITEAALSVLDADDDLDSVRVVLTSPPENGALSLEEFDQSDIAAGTLIYEHDDSQTTSDSFELTLTDAEGAESTATVEITINPVDDAPVIVNNNPINVTEETVVTITSDELLATDPDDEEAAITYTVTTLPTNGELSLTTFTQQDINDGLLVYTFNGDETVNGDNFTFTVADAGGTATEARYGIAAFNEGPSLDVNNGVIVDEGGSAVITNAQLAATDADNAPDTLVYSVTAAPDNGQLSASSFSQFDLDNGLVTYTHNGSENLEDQFEFVLDDGFGGTLSGTFDIAVNNVNDPPQLVSNDLFNVDEGDELTIDGAALAVRDVDDEVETITYTVTSTPLNGSLSAETFTQAELNAGEVVYTHDGSETTEDTFDFSAADAAGEIVAGTVSIAVNPVTDAPSLVTNFPATVTEGSTVTYNSEILLAASPDSPEPDLIFEVVSGPENGTLSLEEFAPQDIDNGLLTYTHDGGENEADSFEVAITDLSTDLTGAGVVEIVVTPLNDTPSAEVADDISVDESALLTITSDILSVTDPDNEAGELVFLITVPPQNGTLSFDTFTQANVEDGALTYSHDGSETSSDAFEFTATDSEGASVTGALIITINSVNDLPGVSISNLALNEGEAITIASGALVSTDVDSSFDQLTYTVTSPPEHGTLSQDTFTQAEIDNGVVVYTHDGSEDATDTFAFTLDDGDGGTVDGSFTFDILPLNDEPAVTTNDGLVVGEGASITITSDMLEVTDPDNSPDQVIYALLSAPVNGTLSQNTFTQADINAGEVVYSHDGSETTSDSFSFRASDEILSTDDAEFTIVIEPVGDPPLVSINSGLTVDQGEALTITNAQLQVVDTDTDLEDLTYVVTAGPVNGELSLREFTQVDIDNGDITYSHNGGPQSGDGFNFTVTDPTGASVSGTVNITINVTTVAPTLVANTGLNIERGETVTITSDELAVEDADTPLEQLTYVIIAGTSNGILSQTIFTQADIEAGNLTYSHNGSASNSDSFEFVVSDGSSEPVIGTFSITVGEVAAATPDFSVTDTAEAEDTPEPTPDITPEPTPEITPEAQSIIDALRECVAIDGMPIPILRVGIPASATFSVICETIIANGEIVTELSPEQLRALNNRPVIQAVDISTDDGTINITEGMIVCLQGQGSLVLLDATGIGLELFSNVDSGFTCGTIFTIGTLALIGDGGTLIEDTDQPVFNPATCVITTTAELRLRAEPNLDSAILAVLPEDFSISPVDAIPGWFSVNYLQTSGWVSGEFVNASGDCGQ